ncbi:MAG: hypothetical protein H6737_21300 [Alphaproteobacteria bacterium]|nr:hypothetical protein [Phycisphaerales bacterium]MCB9677656.1 hypothetical protein [Alphaproteobacteria bacterium]
MTRTLALSSTLLLLAACGGRDPIMVDGFAGDSNVQGRMAGAMPVTGDFDHDLRSGYVWKGPGYVEVDLHVLGSEGWVMLGGGFDPAVMSDDGETVTLDPDEHWIFGCSGPDEWNAEYDQPAEEVQVSKEIIDIDGQEMLQVVITAEFSDDNVVSATVVRPTNNGGDGEE